MSSQRIAKRLRDQIADEARRRCGYCLTAEAVVGAPMEIDHIVPQSRGGPTTADNLWLACSLCNCHKGDRVAALDPETGEVVRLFDPRHQIWREHFAWSPEGDRTIGLTPIGRTTVVALNLNRVALVRARREWVVAGWHPPAE
jgi:5-methylcytosine-specific restriction endonuclease McrA